MLNFQNYFKIFFLLYLTSKQLEAQPLEFSDWLINAKLLYKGLPDLNSMIHPEKTFEVNNLCRIYYTNLKCDGDTQSYYKRQLFNLWTCLNCEFANWIQRELFKLILRFLPTCNSKYSRKINNQFEIHYDEVVKSLQEILNNSRRFEEIILNYYYYIYESDQYFDIDFLRSLVSLDFKIEYIKKLKRNTLLGSDNILVCTLIQIAHSIKRFMNYNCKPIIHYPINPVYGFLIYPSFKDDEDINTFHADLKSLKLESNDDCNIGKTLLLDHVEHFNLITWKTESGKVSVAKAVNRVYENYDLKHTLWFQKNLFDTIMKLLFSIELRELVENKNIPEDTVEYFSYIRKDVLSVYTNLPLELEECFIIIEKNDSKNLKLAINIYFKTIENIKLRHYYDSWTLATFKSKTKNMFNSFRCYIRRLEFLQNENKKYYLLWPHSLKDDSSLSISSKISLSENQKDELCYCFTHLYQICVEINTVMHFIYADIRHSRVSILMESAENIYLVFSSLLDKILFKYSDVINVNIIWNIASLIDKYRKDFFVNKKFLYLITLIRSIMFELKQYCIEICTPPTNNFLFFNNMKFKHLGRVHAVKREIETFLNKITRTKNLPVINIPNVSFFHTQFSNFHSKLKENYNLNDIQINWIGGKRDIMSIYNFVDSKSTVLSPFHFFAFQDAFYKFSIAYVFFKTHPILIEPTDWSESTRENLLNIFTSILECPYPKFFRRIIKDIYNFAKAKLTDHIYAYLDNEVLLIKRQFEKFGVFINFQEINSKDINYDVVSTDISSIIDFVKTTTTTILD